MKITVFGAQGMLGRAVCKAVKRLGHEAVTNTDPIEIRMSSTNDICINCAGIVKQREALDSQFMLVNGYAPHRLALLCPRLVHVSTDCVFTHPGPHAEDDRSSPKDIYAVSKLAGEVTRAPHLTVRTSFVGWGKRGLLHDLLNAYEYRASRNALWSGHTVDTAAHWLVSLAMQSDITGLLHLPGEFQTRYELCVHLKRRFGLGVEVIETDDPGQDRRLISNRWAALDLPAMLGFDYELQNMNRE